MVSHLTVRMAWHDNNWNGNVCQEPDKNYYCTGNNSLLSARLKKNKDVDIESEEKNKGAKLDSIKGYLPPCYWTSNAFSSHSLNVFHKHPMPNCASVTTPINEVLQPFSVFSWPFKLSFNHSKDKRARGGNYPADLPKRIERFINKFEPNKSIIFFYLNYDNPVLDEGENKKYVLLGCALLSDKWDMKIPEDYNFPPDELARLRKPWWDKRNNRKNIDMINFPTIAWNIQFTYDFENNGVLLPYKEYLDYKKVNEADGADKLKEMRILIEEESLISSFKYVAMDIDDDKCIFLLNKLRQSIHKIQEHNLPDIKDFSKEEKVIDNLLEMIWKRRGIYPSLSKIIDILINKDVSELDYAFKGEEIVACLNDLEKPEDLLDKFMWLVSSQELPQELIKYKIYLVELKKQLRFYDIDLIKKLSLFNLTLKQLDRILDDSKAFLTSNISKAGITKNPYILCEDYIPKIDDTDLDKEDIADEPIDFFKIDIGMFPQRFIMERSDQQDLFLRSPERLRALIRDYLKRIGEFGDCYGHVDDIHRFILEYPLFMGDANLSFDKSYLYQTSNQCYSNFIEKLTVVENDRCVFFYLKEVYEAEQVVKAFIIDLFKREDYSWDASVYDEYINSEKETIETNFPNFKGEIFNQERLKLFTNVFKKSLFVISGKAGSGKTHVLGKIVKELINKNEKVHLLAPTGKASLRLRKATGVETFTIDRFIYTNRKGAYWDYLDHLENILIKKNKPKVTIENLIIDESSMVDLKKLVTLLSMIETSGKNKVKRVIFVGDEYQLPPIGLGKPFFDIIEFLTNPEHRKHENYIRLMTNCRNGFDEAITDFADIFSDNPYYEEVIERAYAGGKLSSGLEIIKWESEDDLTDLLEKKVLNLIGWREKSPESEKTRLFNSFHGFDENIPFKMATFHSKLKLDRLQIITPYRSQHYGTLALNDFIQKKFKDEVFCYKSGCIFLDTEKIICIDNLYRGKGGNRRLDLSNGSIGFVKDKPNHRSRLYFFPDEKDMSIKKMGIYDYLKEEEKFERGYSITVHKAQGSDFRHVIVVIPKRQVLISKELLYTALTRSKETVTIFLEKTDYNLFEAARSRSKIENVNSSIFESPDEWRKKLYPDPGIKVKSYQEYCIYKKLQERNIRFKYEEKLKLSLIPVTIKPDFTIYDAKGNVLFYWEHLGILNKDWYAQPWQPRKKAFEEDGYLDILITTDALNGFEDEILDKLIDEIEERTIKSTLESKFSNHHYQLYSVK